MKQLPLLERLECKMMGQDTQDAQNPDTKAIASTQGTEIECSQRGPPSPVHTDDDMAGLSQFAKAMIMSMVVKRMNRHVSADLAL